MICPLKPILGNLKVYRAHYRVDFPADGYLTPLYRSRVPHISLVFREMWDTTKVRFWPLHPEPIPVKSSGIPHLAKNERDVGHPRSVAGPEIDIVRAGAPANRPVAGLNLPCAILDRDPRGVDPLTFAKLIRECFSNQPRGWSFLRTRGTKA